MISVHAKNGPIMDIEADEEAGDDHCCAAKATQHPQSG
jgi:hypothetical protein